MGEMSMRGVALPIVAALTLAACCGAAVPAAPAPALATSVELTDVWAITW